MSRSLRIGLAACLAAVLAATALPAGAQGVPGDQHSDNMRLVHRSPKEPPPGQTTAGTQSDLAFNDGYAYVMNYQGFRIFDISNPEAPVQVEHFPCNGPQNDVVIAEAADGKDYLFTATDTPQTSEACNSTNTTANDPAGSWEGVRVFDVTDPTNPQFIEAVPTDCGAHTITGVPDPANNRVYIYVSSYPLGAAALTDQLPNQTKPDGTQCVEPHQKISIVRVDLANPASMDDRDGSGNYVNVIEDGMNIFTRLTNIAIGGRKFQFAGCHDITVDLDHDRAAAACWEEGQTWDISNPENPNFLNRIRANSHENTMDVFHSSTYTWDGKIIVWGDEAGGGGEARCTDTESTQGRFWFTRNVSLRLLGSFKIPRPQSGNCTAHNMNVVPVTEERRYLLASSWYDGGTSIIDFSNPSKAREIAYYDGVDDPATPTVDERANTWSTYWYNGYYYANDINRGFEIYQMTSPQDDDYRPLPDLYNPQTQEGFVSGGCDVFGSEDGDELRGTDGDDVLCGFGGRDMIVGDEGDDLLIGGSGEDELRGKAGNDELWANNNDDQLHGGPGTDLLFGGLGADFLGGGLGVDACDGGPGDNAFHSCES